MAVTLLEEGECQATELPLGSLELTRILPLDTLPLGNSRVYKSSLRDGPVSMVLQRPETLNQTKDSLH